MRKYFNKLMSSFVAFVLVTTSLFGVFQSQEIDMKAAKNEITLPGGTNSKGETYKDYVFGKNSPKWSDDNNYGKGDVFVRILQNPRGIHLGGEFKYNNSITVPPIDAYTAVTSVFENPDGNYLVVNQGASPTPQGRKQKFQVFNKNFDLIHTNNYYSGHPTSGYQVYSFLNDPTEADMYSYSIDTWNNYVKTDNKNGEILTTSPFTLPIDNPEYIAGPISKVDGVNSEWYGSVTKKVDGKGEGVYFYKLNESRDQVIESRFIHHPEARDEKSGGYRAYVLRMANGKYLVFWEDHPNINYPGLKSRRTVTFHDENMNYVKILHSKGLSGESVDYLVQSDEHVILSDDKRNLFIHDNKTGDLVETKSFSTENASFTKAISLKNKDTSAMYYVLGTASGQGEFAAFANGVEHGAVLAGLDKDLKVVSANFLSSKNTYAFTSAQENTAGKILVGGMAINGGEEFQDLFKDGFVGDGRNPLGEGFVGTFDQEFDFAPRLLSPNKNGVIIDGSQSISKVDEKMLAYIKQDMNGEANKYDDYTSNADLLSRINKNVNDTDYKNTLIDWTLFGLDKYTNNKNQVTYKPGNYDVTFGVADTQNQQTVVSGPMNICAPETATDKGDCEDDNGAEIALHAENFRVKKADVAGIDYAVKAQTKAWNMESGKDESSSNKVKYDTAQVKAEIGVYPLKITYTSSGKTAQKTVYVSVYDEDTNSGPEDQDNVDPTNQKNTELIYAINKTLRVSEAKGKSLDEITGVKAWNAEAGSTVNFTSTVTSDHGESYNSAKPKPGVYTIDYLTTRGTKRQVKVTVQTGHLPEVTVDPLVIELDLGAAQPDVMFGVSAKDKEDGDFAKENIHPDGAVRTDKKGVYKITYTVTDSDGNDGVGYRSYVVGANTVGDKYALFANNFKKHVNDVDATESAILGSAGSDAKAVKENAPTETGNPIVTSDGGYTNVPGPYNIDIAVFEEQTTATTITASVFEDGVVGNDIAIEASDVTKFVSEAKDKEVIDIFKAEGLKAWSVHDGIILTDTITIQSIDKTYTVANPIPGNYSVTFSVVHNGKTQTLTKVLTINGGSDPVMTISPKQVLLNLNDPAPILLEGVSVLDTEDGDITDITPTGTVNTGVRGVYNVSYYAEDSDGNPATGTRRYIVGNDPLIGSNYVLFAHNFEKHIDDVDPSDTAQIIEDAGAAAFNLTTGVQVQPVIKELGGYKAEVGPYNMEFSLTEENTLIKPIVASVYENGDPSQVEIIEMKDKRLRKSEAKGKTMKNITEAFGWNKTTGLHVNVNVTADPVYDRTNPVAANYIATGTTLLGTTQTADVEIINGAKPVITVSQQLVELEIDDDLAPLVMDGVSVHDDEDTPAGLPIEIRTSKKDHQISTADPAVVIVTYNATDNDGNEAEPVTRTYVIGAREVTGTYAIFGKDFKIRKGQVNTDTPNDQIEEKTGVRAVALADGVTPGTIDITNNNGYTNVAATYKINVEVVEDRNSKAELEAEVITGKPPVIKVLPERIELVKNAPAPILTSGVEVTDTEDADIEDKLVVTGTVNTGVLGTYRIDYNVEDSDGNKAHAVRYYFVGAKSLGQEYAIFGEDFSIRKGQVNTQDLDGQVRDKGNVFAQKISDSSDAAIELISLDGYTNVAKDDAYKPSYKVTSEPGVVGTINATVGLGNPPIIKVDPARIELNVGDDVPNILFGVSAEDAEDDNDVLTAAIISTGEVDMSAPGVYVITYSVKDSDGNPATATRSYIVGAKSVGTEYAIFGKDFDIRKGQVAKTAQGKKDQLLEKTDVKTVKIADGTLGQEPMLIKDSGYTNVSKPYAIVYQAKEETLTAGFTATVVDGGIPEITANPKVIELSLNADMPNVLENVHAWDDEDLDLTDAIVPTGDVKTDKPGVYVVNYSVTDSDGNTGTGSRSYIVGAKTVGTKYAMFADEKDIRVSKVSLTNKEGQIRQQTGVHAVRIADGLVMNPNDITMTTDDGYTNVVKKYDPVFSVNDEPTTTTTAPMNVIPGEKPVITVVDPIVTVALKEEITDYMTGVTAWDEEDLDLTSKINPSGQVNTNVPGTYIITYSVTDSDGNSDTKTRSYLVAPHTVGDEYVTYANDFTILVSNVDEVDKEGQIRLKSSVKATKIVDGSDANVTMTTDGGYEAKVKTGGYNAIFKVDNEPLLTAKVNALVSKGNEPSITVEPKVVKINKGENITVDRDYLMDGVTAWDEEDLDLTDAVTPIGTVNPNKEGVQIVTYVVTDSDGNRETATRSYVVGGQVGTEYVIYAEDFDIRKGQVKMSDLDGQLIEKTKVRAQKIVDGSNADVELEDNDGYTNVVKNYYPTFRVKFEPTTKIAPKAAVVKGGTPKIIVDPAYEELNLNAVRPTLEQMLGGVTASDDEDLDLTDAIIATGTVDTKKRGVYVVTYTVEDSDGNSDTATRSYIVDGNIVGTNYVLFGDDFTIRKGEVDLLNKDTQIRERSHVEGRKISDGSLANITLSTDTYDATAGDYFATYVIDAEPLTIVDINIEVIEGNKPKLKINPKTIVLEIGDTPDEEAIRKGVSAWDEEDLDLTDKITYTGTIDTTKPGTSVITYTVVDSDGNSETGVRSYLVNPISYNDKYAIYGSDFEVRKGKVESNEKEKQIRKHSNVRAENIETGQEVDTKMTTDGGYKAEHGHYEAQFVVKGEPAPIATIGIDVIPGSLPTIVADPSYIIVNIGDTLSETELKLDVNATDLEDGNLTSKIEVEGTVDTSKPGTSIITYSVVDSDGNEAHTTRSYLVDPKAHDDEFVIYGTDFSLRTGQVELVEKEEQLRVETGIRAEKIATKEEVSTLLINDGGYTNVAKDYDIYFAVEDKIAVEAKLVAHISLGDKPVIIDETPIVKVELGEIVHPRVDVRAQDTEDLDLTDKISLSGDTVDTNKKGVYHINYDVVDSDGNAADTVTRTYVVGGEHGTEYAIFAENFSILIKDVDVADEKVKEAAKVSAVNLKTKETVAVDVQDLGGYTNAEGLYFIKFGVGSEMATTITIQATVYIQDYVVEVDGNDFSVYLSDLEKHTKEGTLEQLILEKSNAKGTLTDENGKQSLEVFATAKELEKVTKAGTYNSEVFVTATEVNNIILGASDTEKTRGSQRESGKELLDDDIKQPLKIVVIDNNHDKLPTTGEQTLELAIIGSGLFIGSGLVLYCMYKKKKHQ